MSLEQPARPTLRNRRAARNPGSRLIVVGESHLRLSGSPKTTWFDATPSSLRRQLVRLGVTWPVTGTRNQPDTFPAVSAILTRIVRLWIGAEKATTSFFTATSFRQAARSATA
jgi:hypothetical protein